LIIKFFAAVLLAVLGIGILITWLVLTCDTEILEFENGRFVLILISEFKSINERTRPSTRFSFGKINYKFY
jgi:hypothetical protein